MAGQGPGEMRIGAVLRGARERAGLELAEVEERTKIRAKYLRALEDEEWGTLPSEAYAKGFLRTYAQLLGLDAGALVDEFRRQVESGRGSAGYPLGEPVLERHRRAPGGPRGPHPALLLAAFVAVLAAALVAVGLLVGDDDGDDRPRRAAQSEAREERRAERRREQRREQRRERRAAADRVALELEIRAPVAVCLLAGDSQELIDGQVLAAGSHEGPWRAKRFQLRFPSGYDRSQFRLLLDGERERVPEASGPAAYLISAPGRVRPGPPPGPTCP